MEPSPYSEQFTIACNHSWEPAGEVPDVVHLGGLAGNQLGFPLYSSMLRYHTNIRIARFQVLWTLGGETLAQHLLKSLSG